MYKIRIKDSTRRDSRSYFLKHPTFQSRFELSVETKASRLFPYPTVTVSPHPSGQDMPCANDSFNLCMCTGGLHVGLHASIQKPTWPSEQQYSDINTHPSEAAGPSLPRFSRNQKDVKSTSMATVTIL